MTSPPLNAPDAALLDRLKSLVGPSGWRAPEDEPGLLEDPRGRAPGAAALILRPASTKEAAAIVRLAVEARVGLIPISGATGLVRGQIAVDGPPPVLISTARLNRIREVNAEDDALTVEAGVTLAAVQEAAESVGRLFPLSLASEGACRIGGNLSTNAGGVQVLRYGNARDLCLGIEAVMPDGSVLNGLKTLRKDNTGYDLRHLLIGAEGTLGLITAATLKLFPRPAEVATAFVSVADPARAVALLRRMQAGLGDVISMFELIDGAGLGFRRQVGLTGEAPFDETPKWSVLVEAGGAKGTGETFEAVMAEAFDEGLWTEGALAQSEGQRAAFRAIRETLPEANRRIGAVASHDVSVPLSRLAGFVDAATARLAALDPALRVNCFGHVGDGNLHFNVFPPEGRSKADYANIAPEVTRIVHDEAMALGGSFSAEHGVGRLKVGELARYGDPAKLAAMRAIKAALDPAGIMNPGAVLD